MATAIVAARVPVSVRAALVRRADRAGRTLSDEIRLLLAAAGEPTNETKEMPHAVADEDA